MGIIQFNSHSKNAFQSVDISGFGDVLKIGYWPGDIEVDYQSHGVCIGRNFQCDENFLGRDLRFLIARRVISIHPPNHQPSEHWNSKTTKNVEQFA